MNEIEKYEIEREKQLQIMVQKVCPVCEKSLFDSDSFPQWAHRIPKTKAYLKEYGSVVMHHPFNIVLVCSLKCNSSVLLNPATHPIETEALIQKILEDLKDG